MTGNNEQRSTTTPCPTCDGRGEIGGLLPDGGGYQNDPCPDCSPSRHKRFAFMFDTGGEGPAVEADTLAEARESDPSIADAPLTSVWCLKTVNKIWWEGQSQPWEDEAL